MQSDLSINPAILAQFEQYALLFGKSTNRVISEALADWMESIGAGRMEYIANKYNANIS